MGWSVGYDDGWGRDVGYGVPAYCDHPCCNKEINRGLGYVCCGEQIYGGSDGCGLFFCEKHRSIGGKCERCNENKAPFDAKQDHPAWINWKLSDESWQMWRDENPSIVRELADWAGTHEQIELEDK